MSQHLVDSGQRGTVDRADARNGLHVTREGNGSAPPNGLGGNVREMNPSGATPAESDSTLSALDALASALSEMSKDQQLLEGRLRELRRQRSEGRLWREILSEEDPPGTMQVVSRMLACLAKASGTLRKELVDNLRKEGVSIPAIARLFGVTHQRVSNLLRRPSE